MKSIRAAACAAGLCMAITPWAQAQSPASRTAAAAKPVAAEAPPATPEMHMPPNLQLGGQTLRLNGKGTRYRAVVKVYDMGLYVGSKVNSLDQLLADPGPKRLLLLPLRRLTGDSLGVALVQGMQDNALPAERMKMLGHMDRLSKIFGAEPEVQPGVPVVIDYVPGKGTTFLVDGVPKGDPVADPSYFAAVVRVWLGARPADARLKDALLGIETRRTEFGGG